MNFLEALRHIKAGGRVYRENWNEDDESFISYENGIFLLNYLNIGKYGLEWFHLEFRFTMDEMLATDWKVTEQ